VQKQAAVNAFFVFLICGNRLNIGAVNPVQLPLVLMRGPLYCDAGRNNRALPGIVVGISVGIEIIVPGDLKACFWIGERHACNFGIVYDIAIGIHLDHRGVFLCCRDNSLRLNHLLIGGDGKKQAVLFRGAPFFRILVQLNNLLGKELRDLINIAFINLLAGPCLFPFLNFSKLISRVCCNRILDILCLSCAAKQKHHADRRYGCY